MSYLYNGCCVIWSWVWYCRIGNFAATESVGLEGTSEGGTVQMEKGKLYQAVQWSFELLWGWSLYGLSGWLAQCLITVRITFFCLIGVSYISICVHFPLSFWCIPLKRIWQCCLHSFLLRYKRPWDFLLPGGPVPALSLFVWHSPVLYLCGSLLDISMLIFLW